MSALLASALLLFTAAPSDVVVKSGETLADVAKRALGSADAAGELVALNHLPGEAVAPGTKLMLPGPERALALHAIASARNATDEAKGTLAHEQAQTRVARAEELLRQARYDAAASEADAAWRLVVKEGVAPSHFAVAVSDDGKTRVRVRRGDAVRVEADGKVASVAAGERLDVVKGEPLGAPVPDSGVLTPPELLKPAAGAKVASQVEKNGRGSVHLSWKPSEGALGYSVEAVPVRGGKPVSAKVKKPEATLASMAPGAYRWRVKALGQGEEVSSEEWQFELTVNPVKLEVRESSWK